MRKLKTITVAFLFLSSLLFIVFNVSQVHAVGTIRYVATTGSDATGDGSIGNPYKTIQKAVNVSVAGDTIYVRGGNYNERVLFKTNGTAGNPITLSGYPGETAIVDGTGKVPTSSDTIINLGYSWSNYNKGVNYITIKNLVIRNSTGRGIAGFGLNTGHYDINNCTISRCATQGIIIWEYTYPVLLNPTNRINNVSIAHNTLFWCNTTSGEMLTLSNVVDFNIHNNYLYKGLNIYIEASNNSKRGLIYNNRINATPAGNLRPDHLDDPAIYIESIYGDTNNISVYKNTIWGNNTGIGLASEYAPAGSLANISVYNNIINMSGQYTSGAYTHGIDCTYSLTKARDISIYSNTVYGFGTVLGSPIHCSWQNTYIKRLKIQNNIFVVGGSKWKAMSFSNLLNTSSNLVASYNLINKTNGKVGWEWGGGYNYSIPTHTIQSSPKFVNVNSYNFHLNSTSPAIDAATSSLVPSTDYDGNLRPMGLGYDIGAYEVGPSSIIITSDSGFNISNGVRSGTGTAASPYMISNWTVYNVSISGTTKNVTIRDCTILHHVLISGMSASSNLLWSNVIMDGAGHIPLSYIYLTHTLTTFTNSKFYNLSYSYMKNG